MHLGRRFWSSIVLPNCIFILAFSICTCTIVIAHFWLMTPTFPYIKSHLNGPKLNWNKIFSQIKMLTIKISSLAIPFALSSFLFASSISGCSDCKSDCSVNKYKCADESPLCPRLEALCENFFLVQWKEMRCACPKTCKLCTENAQPPEMTTPIPPLAMESPTARCDPVSFPIDVVLILDGSSSITKRLFDQQILGFAKNFARQLDVSPNGHRLAIVQYSGRARTEIQLGAYNDSGLLETAIDAISYMNGGTWTGVAINHAKDRVFDFTRRASKACIVLTDGVSSDRVQGPADQLRQLGVHMIAIGVGPDFNRSELEQIAGDSSHVYTVDTFQNLNNTLAQNLNAKICQDAVKQQR